MRIELPGFKEVETGREPIPAGRYTCLISGAEKKATKDGTSQIVVWEATIVGPDCTGRKLFFNTSLKQKALWNLKALLDACGAPYDDEGFATEEAVGQKVDLQVEQSMWEGRPSNEIKAYYPPSE